MRRKRINLMLFLLALIVGGAIVNVAVAWACVRWVSFVYSSTPALGLKNNEGPSSPPADFPFEFTPEWKKEDSSYGQLRVRYIDDYLHRPLNLWVEERHAGWPLLCLMGEKWVAVVPAQSPESSSQRRRSRNSRPAYEQTTRWLWPVSIDPNSVPLHLPLNVLWPGFAINTLFYAAIVWLFFATPLAIRRRFRRKRGQCATCGYSLRAIASGKCPECGATV